MKEDDVIHFAHPHMEMHARPNLNGNTKEDFRAAADEARRLSEEISKFVNEHLGQLTHGRNYQTVPNGSFYARRDRVCVTAQVAKASDILFSAFVAITQAGHGHSLDSEDDD